MSQVPNGWVSTNLGDVIEMKYGRSLPENSRVPGRFNVYGSNGPVGTHKTSLTNGPTIIIGRKGSIGEIHFSEQPCFPIDTTYYVDAFDVCDAPFTVQLLKFLPLTGLNRATAIPGLNREDAYSLEANVPPLPEQGRIVAKIESLSAKSKRAREHLDHLPRLVEKYKQAILATAFRGELTKGWRAKQERIESAHDLVKRTEEPSQSRGGREATTEVKPGIAGLSVSDPGTEPPEGWAWVRLRRIARQETGHTPSRSHPE
jgi:type I restriction enzyme, S subunit